MEELNIKWTNGKEESNGLNPGRINYSLLNDCFQQYLIFDLYNQSKNILGLSYIFA